jgi:sterol O-acyltransferase
MMKMHSYCAHNGMLSNIYFNMKDEEKRLKTLLDSMPDHGEQIRKDALRAAKEHERREAEAQQNSEQRESLDPSGDADSATGDSSPTSSRRGSDIPVGTPMIPPGSASFTTGYLSQGDLLKLKLAPEALGSGTRARLAAEKRSAGDASPLHVPTPSIEPSTSTSPIPKGNNVDPASSRVPLGTSLEPAHMASARPRQPPSVLTYAPDERIATLARNIDTMRAELTSHGSGGIVWPENIGYKSYWEFMCMPTLCYQLWYPRTTTQVHIVMLVRNRADSLVCFDRMRPVYVVEKVFATFGVFSLIYTITEYYILPYMPVPGESLLKAYMELAVPMIVNYLLYVANPLRHSCSEMLISSTGVNLETVSSSKWRGASRPLTCVTDSFLFLTVS